MKKSLKSRYNKNMNTKFSYNKNIKYTFKTALERKTQYIYRSLHRKCKAQITIDKTNLLKRLSNNKEEENESLDIKYGLHELSCKNENKTIVHKKDITTGVNNKELGL